MLVAPALAACREAIVLSPQNATIMNDLGIVHQKQGNFAEAKQWYEQAASKDYKHGYYNLALMYYYGNGI